MRRRSEQGRPACGGLGVSPGSQDSSLALVSPSCLQDPGGQDTGAHSTGDLVLAAIAVMKGRKARPDTKRLCNWVHRKYGRSVQEVVNEIDHLCDQGILEKVEYKGSISFRVVSDKKLHKRAGRRKPKIRYPSDFGSASVYGKDAIVGFLSDSALKQKKV